MSAEYCLGCDGVAIEIGDYVTLGSGISAGILTGFNDLNASVTWIVGGKTNIKLIYIRKLEPEDII